MLLKKIALLVFFSFSISSIITDIEYYTQEESPYEKIIKNITYYNTSNNKLEKNKLEIYYDNGQLKIEQNYSNNQKHGDYKEYFRDGQIKTEGEYSFDKKEKQWNMYYKYTGVLESKKFYENNSIYKAYYYDKNGKKIDYTNLQDKGIFLNTFEFGCEEISGQAYIKFYNNKIAKSWYNNNFKIINDKIILTKENNVTCEDFSYKTKNYSAEAQLLLKDVAGASEMYEAMHGGQQTTLDELES
ncbi:MAG: hypothetical protein CMG21_00510, partial [Candidatus Marinimicrobia bacterium]|nr:hypothetical protein [Candidatus Neomarinimicrobiota bacterium]